MACAELPTKDIVYKCGVCLKAYTTMCQLHTHMFTHGSGGSYFYNHTTCEAFPRFVFKSSGTQTFFNDLEPCIKDELKLNDSQPLCSGDDIGSCQRSTEHLEVKEESIKCENLKCPSGENEQKDQNPNEKVHYVSDDLKVKKSKKSKLLKQKKKEVQSDAKHNSRQTKKSGKIVHNQKSECKLCGKSYGKKVDLRRHLQLEHKDRKFLCLKCCEVFESAEALEGHKSSIHSRKVHKCELCNKVLSTKGMLEGHYLIHKGQKPFSCDICVPERKFTRKSQLNAHMETHSKVKHLQCEFCGKPFSARYLMINHVKHCAGIKPHKCEFCDMSFVSKHFLLRHRRKHTGEKPFVCEVCAFASSNASCLVRHMRTHTGEKPYVCSYCQMKFASTGALRKHTRIHTQEKPYKCSYCSKSFTQKWNLKTHERQHTGETPYKCDICGIGFKQNVLLKTHVKSHYNPVNMYNSGDTSNPQQSQTNQLNLQVYADQQQQQQHLQYGKEQQELFGQQHQSEQLQQFVLLGHTAKLDSDVPPPMAGQLSTLQDLHPLSSVNFIRNFSKIPTI